MTGPNDTVRTNWKTNAAVIALILAVWALPHLLRNFARPAPSADGGSSHIPMDLLMGTRPAPPASSPAGRADLPAAMRGSDKPLLVEFATDWCPFCRRMEREVFRDPAVARSMREDFDVFRLNPEKDADGARLAQRLGVRAYPTVVFFDASGRETRRVVGYRSAPDFLAEMRSATEPARRGP